MQRYLLPLLIILAACNHRDVQPQAATQPEVPVSFAEASASDIIPVADGGAYLPTYDSGLWYVRGAQAVRVRFRQSADPSQVKVPVRVAGLDIQPTVDGGAYARSFLDNTLWYLREGEATVVVESAAITTQAYPPEAKNRFFALYMAERKARRSAEEELESIEQEPPDYGPEDEYQY